MSLSLHIWYKDLAWESLYYPFCVQSTVEDFWRPLAEKLELSTLRRIDYLHITDRAEAERLAAELRVVEGHLRELGWVEEYPLDRIGEALPLLDEAIAEWDSVAGVSL